MQVVNLDALAARLSILGVAPSSGACWRDRTSCTARNEVVRHETDDLSAGGESLLQLYVLLAAIADPVRNCRVSSHAFRPVCAASDRIFAFLDRVPDVGRNSNGPRLQRRAKEPSTVPTADGVHIEFATSASPTI